MDRKLPDKGIPSFPLVRHNQHCLSILKNNLSIYDYTNRDINPDALGTVSKHRDLHVQMSVNAPTYASLLMKKHKASLKVTLYVTIGLT